MKKQYNVFSVHNQPTAVKAQLNGVEVDAVVDALEIQLVPVDSGSGTLKLSYTNPADIDAARATFVAGADVTIDFSAAVAA